METRRRESRSALVRAASAAIGLANVVRGPRRSPPGRLVPDFRGPPFGKERGGRRQEDWCQNFVVRLLENEPAVTRLLARNPFPDKPPRYVRAILFKYQFTTSEERRATGAWWKRREIGEFFPEATLRR